MIKTTIVFAVGCIVILLMPTLPVINWFWLVLLNIILFYFKPTRYLAVALLAALWTIWQSQSMLDDQLQPDLYQKVLTITGIIKSVPDEQGRILRFNFNPDQNQGLTLPKTIRLSWYHPFPENVLAGEQWRLSVKLKLPHGMMNPGGFDYEGSLFQKGIGATGYVKQASTNIKLADSDFWHLNTLRQKLANKIKHYRPDSDHLGLMQGLLVGIKHNISAEQWQTLRQTGTSHLLAISGLHIGLVATIGFYLFSFVWSISYRNLIWIPAKQIGAIGAISFALGYAALAGFSIPTQRALIMVSVFMTAILIRKTVLNSQLLAIAALIILIIDPIAIISAGFWLSFSAVSIILFISQHRFPYPKWQWAKVHFFIAFGLSPLLLLFFTQTSLIAPVANFFAVPLVSLIIVPLLLLTSALLSTWPAASKLGFIFIDTLFNLLIEALNYLSSLPYSNLDIALSSPTVLISITIATCLILLPRGLPAKWLALLGFLPLLFSPSNDIHQGGFKLTLLDVGQGLAAVIQTQHHTLVFDTGAKFSHQFNAGDAVLIPFLKHLNIHHIDMLIISHSDNDHIGGAKSLLTSLTTSSILTSQTEHLSKSMPCIAGQAWQWDDIYFKVLNPTLDQVGNDNNLSCVLRVSNGQHSVLLTGDIEKQAEQKIVHRYQQNLASTVLVAPHHGSKTSSTQKFVNAVNPQFVLFPAGYLNRYHFPNITVLERYLEMGAIPYSTARSGAISIHFQTDTKPEINTWRHQGKRIWTSVAID
ncbi:MAG: competence protein ComEC [Methylophagaceae bacterium]|jgi:competence protein ComEC